MHGSRGALGPGPPIATTMFSKSCSFRLNPPPHSEQIVGSKLHWALPDQNPGSAAGKHLSSDGLCIPIILFSRYISRLGQLHRPPYCSCLVVEITSTRLPVPCTNLTDKRGSSLRNYMQAETSKVFVSHLGVVVVVIKLPTQREHGWPTLIYMHPCSVKTRFLYNF